MAAKRRAGTLTYNEAWMGDMGLAARVLAEPGNSAELTCHGQAAVETIDIPLGQLRDHPDNPDPLESEVLQMMVWLQTGQAEPIQVRPLRLIETGGKVAYQVLAGKTRLRAAERLDWLTLRAEVHCDLDDDLQAAAFACRSNLERRHEGPLRQAAWGKALIARRLAVTCSDRQTTEENRTEALQWAAARMGLSPEGLRAKLRFNLLPEPWRSRITPGPDGEAELSERVARSLLPYAHVPAILHAADKNFKLVPNNWDRWRWRDEAEISNRLRDTVTALTGPIDGERDYGYELGYKHPCYFKLDDLDEQTRAKLQIVEVPDPEQRNASQRVCLNLKEYLRLQKPAVKRAFAEKKKHAAVKARNKDTKHTNHKPAAKSKAETEHEAKRQQQLLEKRVDHWRHRWLLSAIVPAMSECDWQLQRVWLLLVCVRDRLKLAVGNIRVEDLLELACKDVKLPFVRPKSNGAWDSLDTPELWSAICSVPLARFSVPELRDNRPRQRSCELQELTLNFVRRMFALEDKNKYWPVVPYAVADQLAIDYGLDLERLWTVLQGRTGTAGVQADWEPFLHLFQLPQLQELCRGWKIYPPDNCTATTLRKMVLGQQRTLPMPAILKPLEPKRAQKKAKSIKDCDE